LNSNGYAVNFLALEKVQTREFPVADAAAPEKMKMILVSCVLERRTLFLCPTK